MKREYKSVFEDLDREAVKLVKFFIITFFVIGTLISGSVILAMYLKGY